jgi:dipeptidyl aminopeptidase/acylaminoacyl peptidase
VLGSPKGLTWSADGSQIIFANDSGDGGGLWQVDLEGRVSRVPLGEEASMPVAARDDRIAYARGRQRIDIWRIDLQSASPTRDTTRLISSTRIQMNPRYSPDGSRIAFQSTRSGANEIWVANADGSNPTRISSFNGPIAGAPTWCSDGKRLAFDSRASGISALYIADIEERQPRRLDTSVENLALPAWSSDCRWLLASKLGDALYIVPVGGGAAKRFTEQPSYYADVTGDDVIFNVKEPQSVALWRKRIGGDEEQPLQGMPTLSYNDGWAVTSAGIYFTVASEDPKAIRFYRFATKTIEPVAQLAQPPAPAGGLGLSVSSDARWLLYTQVEEQHSDIMVLTRE